MSDLTTGEKIRHYRERAGLTRRDFATLVGVSTPCVHYWETDTHEPKRAHWPAIVAALGASRCDLIGEVG